MLADTNRKTPPDKRVTARGQLMSPHFQITVPAQITGREILSCDATPEKTQALNVIPLFPQLEQVSQTIRLD